VDKDVELLVLRHEIAVPVSARDWIGPIVRCSRRWCDDYLTGRGITGW